MNKKYKLFLDDIRDVKMVYKNLTDDDFVIVRNFYDFKKVILENGLPELISFDNDLGLDENDLIAEDGYAAAKWLVYESGLDLQNLKFNVHSANPVAAQQIQSLLDNYIKHLKSENNQ
ncbi:cyclic-phosphate processing receiver domain-containing protein [Flavobacterium sp. FlaQc-48]|uniref:cyclic-phosphate processing receiver domain-containing protein n=1 Tax=Flavobacterium sp. FlaQc-48 TaxID=3374181 RepID=UPI003757AA4B